MNLRRQSDRRLRWQSQLPLFLVIALATGSIALQCVALSQGAPARIVQALLLGTILALLVWRFRSATGAAAVTGGLFTMELYLVAPGWRTLLWPFIALLLLTLAATRFGRTRKERLGLAEGRHGRAASQVAANLGIAVLASIPIGLSPFFHVPHVFRATHMELAVVAALAEAAADTLSSELGEVPGGEPRLITTFSPVPAGTDGAISVTGTLAGLTGGAAVAIVASVALGLTPLQTAIVWVAAVVGLFVDSFLGAVFERRGWLNNDGVNFLSTLASAALVIAIAPQ